MTRDTRRGARRPRGANPQPARDAAPGSIVANDTGLESTNITVAESSTIIKSVRRTFEILEFFERTARPASLMTIARALGLPASSASMLMHSLSTMGYVTYDPNTREFVPTMRVSLLGAWIQPFILSDLNLVSVMSELHAQCGHTIMAGYLNGLYVQYIHVIQGVTPVRYYLAPGSSRLAVRSTLGMTLLSTMTDKQIGNITTRARQYVDKDVVLQLAPLRAEIERVRKEGYAYTTSLGTKGVGVIAALLPVDGPHPAISLGIGGPSDIIAAERHTLLKLLFQHTRAGRGPAAP